MPGSGKAFEIQPGRLIEPKKPDWWLDYWHGVPDMPFQIRYFRCEAGHLVTWHQIHAGGCPCKASKLRPAYLSIWELVKVNFLPWMVGR